MQQVGVQNDGLAWHGSWWVGGWLTCVNLITETTVCDRVDITGRLETSLSWQSIALVLTTKLNQQKILRQTQN